MAMSVVFNAEQHTVIVDGHRIPLTPMEMLLMETLVEADGRAVSTEDLLRQLCLGVSESAHANLRVLVQRTRRKVGPGSLLSIPNYGYLLLPTNACPHCGRTLNRSARFGETGA